MSLAQPTLLDGVPHPDPAPAPAGPPPQPCTPAAPPSAEKGDAGAHSGHRQRLRQRFLTGGADALADYELLELLLFQAVRRGDVKPLAKRLLARFGSFGALVSAAPEEIAAVKGAGPAVVAALKTVQACALRLLVEEAKAAPVLGNWKAVIDYCRAAMGREKVEQFRVLFLDKKNRLVGDEVQQRGTVDHTPVYPREVARRALELGASAVILVHNHPSGDPTPSRADIDMTGQVRAALETLGVTLHDHLIIGGGDHVSLRGLELI